MGDLSARSCEEIAGLVRDLEPRNRMIIDGRVRCARHDLYHAGAKSRKDLDFGVPMGHFSEEEHEVIMEVLKEGFLQGDNSLEVDYIVKVLFPETMIKLFMDDNNMLHAEAEEALFNKPVPLEKGERLEEVGQTAALFTKLASEFEELSNRPANPPSHTRKEAMTMGSDDDDLDEDYVPAKDASEAEEEEDEDDVILTTPKHPQSKVATAATTKEQDDEEEKEEEGTGKKEKRRCKKCHLCEKVVKMPETEEGGDGSESEGGDGSESEARPVPGCKKMICRVDLHLHRIHGINKLDTEYARYNATISSKRMLERPAPKSSPKAKKARRDPDPTVKAVDLVEPSDSSDEAEETSFEPRAPKPDPETEKIRTIADLPVMRFFFEHLVNFEGGMKNKPDAKEHTHRVCRMLYEVDSNPSDVSLLWKDMSLDIIRNHFFWENDLSTKPRAAQTLKTYLLSLKMFLKMIIARQEGVRRHRTLTDVDMREIQSALVRLETWPSPFRVAFNKRTAELRKRDTEERLTSKDFEIMKKSDASRRIVDKFHELRDNPDNVVDVNAFSEMRDYIIYRLLLDSAQRCGAVGNLTVKEFQSGEMTWKNGKKLYVTKSLRHKTASKGPAKLYWDVAVKEMADTYIRSLRPLFANERSFLEAQPGVRAEPALFINSAGNVLNESRVSFRVIQMGKKLVPEAGTIRGSRIRKGIISMHRDQGESATISIVAA